MNTGEQVWRRLCTRPGVPTEGWVYIGGCRSGRKTQAERCARGVQGEDSDHPGAIVFIVSFSGLGIFQTTRLWACLQKLFQRDLTEEERATLNWGSAMPWAGSPELTRIRTGGSQQNTCHIPFLGCGHSVSSHLMPTAMSSPP